MSDAGLPQCLGAHTHTYLLLSCVRKPWYSILATVFTLSSHHPFVVPDDFDSVLPRGDFPMQHTVAYTDMALQKFFDKISKSKWYDRTLFVITADHTNFTGSQNIDYERLYDVPMVFYHPKLDTAFVADKIMQQTDIMPSVISCLGIDGQ